MIRRYTYFAGLRITINNARVGPNSDPLTKQVLPFTREDFYSSIDDVEYSKAN